MCQGSSFVFSGNKYTNQFSGMLNLFIYVYNYKFFIPVLLLIIGSLLTDNILYISLVPIIVCIMLNKDDIFYSMKSGYNIIINKNALRIL